MHHGVTDQVLAGQVVEHHAQHIWRKLLRAIGGLTVRRSGRGSSCPIWCWRCVAEAA
jgi:hypothetical protein